jgi:hypothetical protein
MVRGREDARAHLMRARHPMSKLLLRPGAALAGCRLDPGLRHLAAPAALDQAAPRVAFEEAYGAVPAVQARRGRLDAAIAEPATTSAWAPLVGRLGACAGSASGDARSPDQRTARDAHRSCGSQPAHISLTARRRSLRAAHRPSSTSPGCLTDGHQHLPLDSETLHISCGTRRTAAMPQTMADRDSPVSSGASGQLWPEVGSGSQALSPGTRQMRASGG